MGQWDNKNRFWTSLPFDQNVITTLVVVSVNIGAYPRNWGTASSLLSDADKKCYNL